MIKLADTCGVIHVKQRREHVRYKDGQWEECEEIMWQAPLMHLPPRTGRTWTLSREHCLRTVSRLMESNSDHPIILCHRVQAITWPRSCQWEPVNNPEWTLGKWPLKGNSPILHNGGGQQYNTPIEDAYAAHRLEMPISRNLVKKVMNVCNG